MYLFKMCLITLTALNGKFMGGGGDYGFSCLRKS